MNDKTSRLKSHDTVQTCISFYLSLSPAPITLPPQVFSKIGQPSPTLLNKCIQYSRNQPDNEREMIAEKMGKLNQSSCLANISAGHRQEKRTCGLEQEERQQMRREQENILFMYKHYFCLALSLNTILVQYYLFIVGLPSFRHTSEAMSRVTTTEYKWLVSKSLCLQRIFRKAPAKNVLVRNVRTQ